MVDAMKLRRTWGTRHGIKCERPGAEAGPFCFLVSYYFQYTKRTVTHLLSISFW
jgi:hypothetical protein